MNFSRILPVLNIAIGIFFTVGAWNTIVPVMSAAGCQTTALQVKNAVLPLG